MNVAVTAEPLPCLTSLLVVHGNLAIRTGREETTAGPSDVALLRLGVPLGWASPSHFAAAYLKAYGRHPRHTLRA